MNERDCTSLFLHYREVVRLVRNLGFWPDEALRNWDSVAVFREAAARLFEGLVLLPLGRPWIIEDTHQIGIIDDFIVRPNGSILRLSVDSSTDPGLFHSWGEPDAQLHRDEVYRLRFLRFFDWDERSVRDFALVEVVIEEWQRLPDLVGRHALIQTYLCSFLLSNEKSEPDTSMPPVTQERAT